MEQYDVIVVGAGPSGLTAALYCARRGLKTVVLSQDIGGQASTTGTVENYPGFDLIDGFELMTKFQQQAEKYGAVIKLEEVQGIAQPEEQDFVVKSSLGEYSSPVVIVAYGLTHKHLEVPGEKEHIGKGVTYCATCDAPLYKGKAAAVVGGGNSAMDAALLLSKFSPEVHLVTHNAEFRGEKVLIDRVNETPSIKQYLNATTKEVQGGEHVSGLVIEHEGATKELAVEGVFVEIGFTVNPQLVKDLLLLDGRNQIIINQGDNSTNIPGLFAAGDVTTIGQKQIVISAGEGAKAALGAHQYLQSLGKIARAGIVDWGVSTPMRHADSSTTP